MYRYDYYYGYWDSDTDSDGGGYKDTPNLGDGGRDTGYEPPGQAPPPPPPPPVTASLVSTTPAVMTLNELDEYNGSGAGYIPAGQFTEARAYPLAAYNQTYQGVTKLVVAKNQRTNYTYGPMVDEIFRFPYYVPAGANLATLPPPKIHFWASAQNNSNGPAMVGSVKVEAVNTTAAPTTWTWNYNHPNAVFASNSGVPNGTPSIITLTTDQMLSFQPGQFNDFHFKIKISNPEHLTYPVTTGTTGGLNFYVSNIETSLPTGFEFEFKLQKNWESTFGINVVKDTDRNQKGTVTSLQSFNNPPQPSSWGHVFNNNWTWNEYNTAQGFKHWEIPVSKFVGNKQFSWPITVFPENDEFCSMEPGFKLPGPKAPWNLLSRHESFWYAPTKMRVSDYAQDIAPNAIFYCPRNWRAVVWLKQGVAINDIL